MHLPVPPRPRDLPAVAEDVMEALAPWHRFHLRITAFYAVAVMLILTATGVVSYRVAVDARLEALQERLLVAAGALAEGVDGDEVALAPLTRETDLHDELYGRFVAVARRDPSVHTIYLMRRTDDPGMLQFVVDYDRGGEEAPPGELYDGSPFPLLLQGLEVLSVEEEVYVDAWGPSLSAYAPIRASDGRSVGLLGIDVKEETLGAIRWRVLRFTGGMYLVAAALLALVSVVVGRSVRDPLSRVIEASSAVARGRFDTRIDLHRADEFGVMGRHFDHMAAGLQEREVIRQTFGRYVSPDVARQVLASGAGPALGGEERVVTVLFADLQGYSTFSEGLTPTQLVTLLNRYLAGMQEVIDAHHGVVIEFLGDAVLAVFGAPAPLEAHPEHAVRCAIAMRERLDALNVEWQRDGLARMWQQAGIERLRHRVGVHTGRVVAGNLGSETRVKYAVIGDTVNVASRLEQLNKQLGTDILVSGEVAAALDDDLVARLVDRGTVEVKGRREAVAVLEVS